MPEKAPNNTNKFNPQEPFLTVIQGMASSNNTNKFNPQEHEYGVEIAIMCSNNTNKFNPQELQYHAQSLCCVQIIQINSILKNNSSSVYLPRMFK